MKNIVFILMSLFCVSITNAQEKKDVETVIISTNPRCGDCKERIEEMLNYTKGIKFAELDMATKKITIKYIPSKITLQEIKKKISDLGYDADDLKANQSGIDKLPTCCKPGGMEK